MTDSMHYAFIDESGTVGAETGTHFLVIAAICGNRARDIEIPVRRAQKKFGTSLASGEMKKSPARGDLTSGSPWALISIFPAAFQRRLGHSPSDRGHQALRYRSNVIIAPFNRL
jgi:hypothetical protein